MRASILFFIFFNTRFYFIKKRMKTWHPCPPTPHLPIVWKSNLEQGEVLHLSLSDVYSKTCCSRRLQGGSGRKLFASNVWQIQPTCSADRTALGDQAEVEWIVILPIEGRILLILLSSVCSRPQTTIAWWNCCSGRDPLSNHAQNPQVTWSTFPVICWCCWWTDNYCQDEI